MSYPKRCPNCGSSKGSCDGKYKCGSYYPSSLDSIITSDCCQRCRLELKYNGLMKEYADLKHRYDRVVRQLDNTWEEWHTITFVNDALEEGLLDLERQLSDAIKQRNDARNELRYLKYGNGGKNND